jgi:hypothetical protein
MKQNNSHTDEYFFIHYIEIDSAPSRPGDCIQLNSTGWLYIGSALWYPNDVVTKNTFFNLEDARTALRAIEHALSHTKGSSLENDFKSKTLHQ